MVKTEPGANKEDHDQLVEDIDNPEDNYGDDSHQGGDDTFGADDTYGAGGADDIGFEGDEGGAGPSEIGKDFSLASYVQERPGKSYVWKYCRRNNKEQATCEICMKEIRINYNGIKYHLKSAHGIVA